jgi:RimJ/RimL family protein N-acetyltransferase
MRFGPDFREVHTLKDGCQVTLRMIRPSDKEPLRAAIARLSPESRYRRFFASVGDPSDKTLEYLTNVDGRDHFAIVAERDSLDLKTVEPLGVARFIRLPEAPNVAEAAVTVGDWFQHRGLGKLLAATMAEAAVERGITKFRGEVLATNEPMLHLLHEIGAEEVHLGGDAVAFDVSLTDGESTQGRLERVIRAAGQQMFEVLRRFM